MALPIFCNDPTIPIEFPLEEVSISVLKIARIEGAAKPSDIENRDNPSVVMMKCWELVGMIRSAAPIWEKNDA